jgi:hypothetical protein
MPASIQNTIHVLIEVTSDATGAGLSFVIPRALTIIDASVTCSAANGAGTLIVNGPGGAITDAMICAVDTTVVRAATIDDANAAIAAGASVTVVANGAADRGDILLTCHATPAQALL